MGVTLFYSCSRGFFIFYFFCFFLRNQSDQQTITAILPCKDIGQVTSPLKIIIRHCQVCIYYIYFYLCEIFFNPFTHATLRQVQLYVSFSQQYKCQNALPNQVMPFLDHLASLGKPASSIISLFKATQILYSTSA